MDLLQRIVNTSIVITYLDGSLEEPPYISTFPKKERVASQKVFPFSLSLAAIDQDDGSLSDRPRLVVEFAAARLPVYAGHREGNSWQMPSWL